MSTNTVEKSQEQFNVEFTPLEALAQRFDLMASLAAAYEEEFTLKGFSAAVTMKADKETWTRAAAMARESR
jgi:hypothetical protein